MSTAKPIGPQPAAGVPRQLRVRDRIFEAACEMFYRQGIRNVGIEAILSACASNKMSFYRSFESKDALIVEYLRESGRGYWAWFDEVLAQHEGAPRKQIEALFQALLRKSCDDWRRGCPLANVAVEIPEDDHPGREVARAFKRNLRERLRQLSRALGAHRPEDLGDALLLLMEGAQSTRLSFGVQGGPAEVVPEALEALLSRFGAPSA